MTRSTLPRLSALAGALALFGCSDNGGQTTGSAGDTGTTSAGDTTSVDPTVTPTTEPTTTTSTTGPTGTTGPTTGESTSTADASSTGDASTGDSTGVVSTGHVDDSTTAPAPTCDDGEKNQDESDIDCGGMVCTACEDGQACAQNEDCAINSCIAGVCAAPACDDGQKNGEETDLDCGGGCQPCGEGLGCAGGSDCDSEVCTDQVCVAANCGDGVQNGDETDIDCGGGMCAGCQGELACAVDDDCLSQICTAGVCDPTECLVDLDCDSFDSECTEGVCQKPGFTCTAMPVNEAASCEDNNLCVEDTVCAAGVCGGGAPKNCANLSNGCNAGVCDPDNGQCVADPFDDGTACFIDVCSPNATCMAGACVSPAAPNVFSEDFSDNGAGWELGNEWAIGPASASNCPQGNDPASDHTPTGDNGVAGVVLGGCATTSLHDFYCMTSPVIDVSGVNGNVYLAYWRWLTSDYTPFMQNRVQVFNGTTWVTVFQTESFPGVVDASWQSIVHDVTAHKNPMFRARWCHTIGSSGAYTIGSWNLDDVTVGPNTCG